MKVPSNSFTETLSDYGDIFERDLGALLILFKSLLRSSGLFVNPNKVLSFDYILEVSRKIYPERIGFIDKFSSARTRVLIFTILTVKLRKYKINPV